MWDDFDLSDDVASGNWGSSADVELPDYGSDAIENAWNTDNWDFGSSIGDVGDSLSQYFDWNSGGNALGNNAFQGGYSNLPAESSYNDLANYGGANTGISQTLASIFNSPITQLGAKGIAALYAGNQNKKAADSYKKLAGSPTIDPFGSQRPFYQQQLQQAIQNPNSIPMIQQQTQALAREQAIKDAAAGRRSNNATSSPGLMLAQSQAAQNYINSLMNPAGANISPNAGAYTQAMSNSINAGTNGYTSPLLYLLGNATQNTTNSNTGKQTNALQDIASLFS